MEHGTDGRSKNDKRPIDIVKIGKFIKSNININRHKYPIILIQINELYKNMQNMGMPQPQPHTTHNGSRRSSNIFTQII